MGAALHRMSVSTAAESAHLHSTVKHYPPLPRETVVLHWVETVREDREKGMLKLHPLSSRVSKQQQSRVELSRLPKVSRHPTTSPLLIIPISDLEPLLPLALADVFASKGCSLEFKHKVKKERLVKASDDMI